MTKSLNSFWHTWKIISLLSLAFLLLNCTEAEVENDSSFSDTMPDEQADSLTIYAYSGDFLEYKLTAYHIDKYYDDKITFADTVYIETYNQDNSIGSSLYCDRAELNETNNILTGYGHVVINSENGILKTPYIIWDRNSDLVTAKNGVTVIRENNILHGQELKTDINLEEIEMIKVSAEGTLDEMDINW